MRTTFAQRIRQRGVTVLELMIGMTIGLVASIVIVQVFSQSEAHRRAVSGGADAQQAGTIVSWRMMRDLRLAGSGLQHGIDLWGCRLIVWQGGQPLLPRDTPWPRPFNVFPSVLRLSPIVVVNGVGTAPDAIMVMSARTGASPAPVPASVVSETEVNVQSSTGFRARDLVLMTDMSSTVAVPRPCQIGQVDPAFVIAPGVIAPRAVPTGAPGTGYNGPRGMTDLASNGDYALFNLGALPSITMYAVQNTSLMQFDVLDPAGIGTGTVQAENVENLQVLLGVDDGTGGVANDNVIDRWVTPGTGGFTMGRLAAGTNDVLQVKAIRIALVLRASSPSQRAGPSETLLFPDMRTELQVRLPIPENDRAYARQVHDLVIPLRNQWIALCTEDRRLDGLPAPGSCS